VANEFESQHHDAERLHEDDARTDGARHQQHHDAERLHEDGAPGRRRNMLQLSLQRAVAGGRSCAMRP